MNTNETFNYLPLALFLRRDQATDSQTLNRTAAPANSQTTTPVAADGLVWLVKLLWKQRPASRSDERSPALAPSGHEKAAGDPVALGPTTRPAPIQWPVNPGIANLVVDGFVWLFTRLQGNGAPAARTNAFGDADLAHEVSVQRRGRRLSREVSAKLEQQVNRPVATR